ncbi:MAG: histidine--tRNA ligase [Pseudomonadota bacterium]
MAKDKKKRSPRPKAETPRGFRDYLGAEVLERQAMLREICKVYHAYGFDPLETSAVETVEALGSFLPDVDRPNAGVFAWQDEDESWMALRYDLTAPLARVFAQHRESLPAPYRRYAVGPVWRNEKPGPGRYRQFYQCDADTVGTQTVAADAEICMMLADAFEAVGITSDDVLIRINNRKVLNGVMEAAGLLSPDAPEAMSEQRGIVLRAIDKLDRLGEDGVRALLGEGRKDESGDFTKGAGLSANQVDVVMSFVGAHGEVNSRLAQEMSQAAKFGYSEYADRLSEARESTEPALSAYASSLNSGLPLWNAEMTRHLQEITRGSAIGLVGVQELEQMAELLEKQGYEKRIRIDPSVVRGLGYYTGPVFEAELTFEITDEDGNRRQFGSVAGGGRYDDLVKRFTGQTVPATGISIGVDRLLAALRAKGRISTTAARGPVIILPMDRDRMADYQTMCAELRRAKIRAEVFLGGGNLAKQLKYADRRAAPIAVIEGADEHAAGQVTLKDLVLGARLAAEIETREEWTAQPAQKTVARADLVAEIQAMLAQSGATPDGMDGAGTP